VDLRLLLSTFASIFLAELGDKTQLAALALSSGTTGKAAKWTIFAGSALALVTSSAIAVLAGELVSRHVSPIWLRRAAGGAFLLLGSWFLLRPAD